MVAKTYPYYLANEACQPNQDLEVLDKYSGTVVSRVAMADRAAIDTAITRAVEAMPAMHQMAPFERQRVLQHCVQRFQERHEDLAQALCLEAGKPIRDSRAEVTRLIDTFRIAAEESVRIYGEVMPMEISERAKGLRGMWKRVPIGPCSFISPFNFPLNLAAHKVAPALAVGCSFVMKPASRTPLGALIIGEVLAETDLPKGAFSILPVSRDGAELFTVDDRLKLLSFTGSPGVGWSLKAKAGKKKVVLELGGNAAVIVEPDADLEFATERILWGAFYQSGQSCIGVQRILIHADIYEKMKQKLVESAAKLKVGDPREEDTFVGPIISQSEADRIRSWVESAQKAGAKLLIGGPGEGVMIPPTLLEDVPKDQQVHCEEVFGPVAVLEPYNDFAEAIDFVNQSDFGLQMGVFTYDIRKVHQAWDQADVGGVVIGDVPSIRVDHMPYGGVKDSGLGREGIRFAMEDMTEVRMLIVRD